MKLKLKNIRQVKTVKTDIEANELLQQGWSVLAIGQGQEHTSNHAFYPYVTYYLGSCQLPGGEQNPQSSGIPSNA